MTMIGGTTEFQIQRALSDCFKKAEGCCRQMAHMRGDTRWLALGMLCDQLSKKSLDLATRKTGLPGTLVLPPHVRNWRERDDHPGTRSGSDGVIIINP